MSSGFSCKVPDGVVQTCYEYEGVIMPNIMPSEAMKRVRKLACRPDDMFIVTYPKSGTTWAEQLVLLIERDGDITKLEGKHVTQMIVFLEIINEYNTSPTATNLRIDEVEIMTSPRTMKTHCEDAFLPLDISNDDPKAKVLYIARNPKDTAVSYYYFCNFLKELPTYESWDVYFEEFLAGRAPQGSWFNNVLPWWKRRNHPNVLFLKYEDMKKDLPSAVRQIAEFMGKSLSDDVIEKISKASTFKAMKKNPASNPDSLIPKDRQKSKDSFMRKGIIGDWKNCFTEEQNKRFDELYEKELAGTGLELTFE
ncbi:sulfotransferase family cytosolic 1B member 1 [Strongylocentrotus purpuratus]|uniref:Sulfotransferase domain-containing protein n=1 Tax=Strongylocentrotus purpuratus TaxID=7668 RepID=A0A7M7RHD5_STRPU|nr:sulfotransferase family cytosolic 1B member 1 [Strongylocentrotus purpuratus]XP_797947.4 sulfotransferase family cytosolic 1B member 1 [Strongylocentrotus purpuratus]